MARVARRCRLPWMHPLTRSQSSLVGDMPNGSVQLARPPEGYNPYTLLKSTEVAPNSKLLRFALPSHMPILGLPLPSCMRIRQEIVYGDRDPAVLDKSYSIVSNPAQEGFFELLVRGYPPRPLHEKPGGLGAFLVGLKPGESAVMKAKEPRFIHDFLYTPNRWKELGLVAGGTGVAPMLQMIRTILADPSDKTLLSLVFASRHEEDILMREELDMFAKSYPRRFRVHYVLSSPPLHWRGGRGHVSAEDLGEKFLPAPSDGTMIFVCGTDQFLETVSGLTRRGSPPPGKKKGPKIQGELTGLLANAGYEPKHVYKF